MGLPSFFLSHSSFSILFETLSSPLCSCISYQHNKTRSAPGLYSLNHPCTTAMLLALSLHPTTSRLHNSNTNNAFAPIVILPSLEVSDPSLSSLSILNIDLAPDPLRESEFSLVVHGSSYRPLHRFAPALFNNSYTALYSD